MSEKNNISLDEKSVNNQNKLNKTQTILDKTNKIIEEQNKKLEKLEKALLKIKTTDDKSKIKKLEKEKNILVNKQKKTVNTKEKLEVNKEKLEKNQNIINEEKSNEQQKNELISQDDYIKKQLEKQETILNKKSIEDKKNTDELTNQQDEININEQKELNNMIEIGDDDKDTQENVNDNKIESEEVEKQENECRIKRFDCLANNKDIYSVYKKDYKYMKNWSFDVTDNDTSSYDKNIESKCSLNNDCSICPVNSSNIPNSIELKDVISGECKYESCDKCLEDTSYILYDKAYDKNKLKKYKKGYNKK